MKQNKRILTTLLVSILMFTMVPLPAMAAATYGYEVIMSPSPAAIGEEVTLTFQLTDYTEEKSGIRGFQIDITDVDNVLHNAVCTALVTDTEDLLSNTAKYQQNRDLVRHAYAKMSGAMSYENAALLEVTFTIPQTYTEAGILSLPLRILIQNEAGDKITYTDTIDVLYSPEGSNPEPSKPEHTTHTAAEQWSSDQNLHWKQCTGCEEKLEAANHTYGDWYETKPSTQTTEGEERRVCGICGHYETRKKAPLPGEGGTCGENLTWTLDEDGVLTISGTGAMADYSYKSTVSAPWSAYTDQIRTLVIGEGVTSLGNYAFYNCTGLTNVTIPDSVTHIGKSAFSGCKGITEVVMSDTVTTVDEWAFAYCENLTSIALPDGLATLGRYVFYSCTKLDNVTIPEGITYVADALFYECSSLASITLSPNTTEIGRSVFRGCTSLEEITIPEGTVKIHENAFTDCSSLMRVNIPNGVTRLGSSAFEACKSLKSIALPGSVNSMASGVFRNCTGLESVEICEGVESIEAYTFAGCQNLTELVFPKSISFLGDSIIGTSEKMETLYFTGNAPSISDSAFNGITATAYYPAGNDTWEEDVLQNCGGTITWVSYGGADDDFPENTPPELKWFFDKLKDPGNPLWATGRYARIMEQYGNSLN